MSRLKSQKCRNLLISKSYNGNDSEEQQHLGSSCYQHSYKPLENVFTEARLRAQLSANFFEIGKTLASNYV